MRRFLNTALRAWILSILAVLLSTTARSSDAELAYFDELLATVQPGQTNVQMGDMLVRVATVKWWRSQLAGGIGTQSTSPNPVSLWPGGVVYYAIDPSVNAANRAHFLDACAEWATFANLTFVERTSEPNYILLSDDPNSVFGFSGTGMLGGAQPMRIGTTAWNRPTLLHEIGHALGLLHEHQRSDRDTYITVIGENVPGGAGNGGWVRIPNSINRGPYDFRSIMHYARDTATANPGQDAIVTKPEYAEFMDIMGRWVLDRWLSRSDREGMAQMYGPAAPLSLVVTNTKDAGPGSLRAALYMALDVATDDPSATPVISFQIPTSDPGFANGTFTIRPTARWIGAGPRVVIDGATQTAFTGDTNPAGPEIVIHGGNIAVATNYGIGFRLGEQGTVLRNMVISGFSTQGILITGSNNVVEGCYIGTNPAGTAADPNAFAGIQISDGATGNRIGGLTPAERNVISGNSAQGVLVRDAGTTGNVIRGNHIGTNAAGTAAVANAFPGVAIIQGAADNTLGGTAASARNVISGNLAQGVYLGGAGTSGNVVLGNCIGLNAAGNGAIANAFAGVEISANASGNTIGGADPGSRNVISGNAAQGVVLSQAGTSGNLVRGNYIGTNSAGTAALPNAFAGVAIINGAANNIVGGTENAAGNTISGNSSQGVVVRHAGTSGNRVQGNLIGTNAAGTAALGNSLAGVQIFGGATNNTIGGTALGARNVISGNLLQGVVMNDAGTAGNIVAGNFIGTNSAGLVAVPNVQTGVDIFGGASGNFIGGAEPGAGNVISGNSSRGVAISGTATATNMVAGNLIGLNATGSALVPNNAPGIVIFGGSTGNLIGGTSGGRNFICGNTGMGISISGVGTNGNLVQGNSIGVGPSGVLHGNNQAAPGAGVQIFTGAQLNTIGGTMPGSANFIAGHGLGGVEIFDTATRNSVTGNSFQANGRLAIDLVGGTQNARVTANDAGDGDTGPNGLQNFPVLSSAVLGIGTSVNGSLNSAANAEYRIDFYANVTPDPAGFGEAETFIGAITVTTNASGNATFNAVLPACVPAGQHICASATDSNGSTSELSQNVVVTTADSDGDGLPNAYESAHGLNPAVADADLDNDNDGHSNLAEFRAGTNLHDPSSALRLDAPVVVGSSVQLSLPTEIGRVYRIERTDSLASWEIFVDQVLGTGAPIPFTDAGGMSLPRRFYRASVLP